MWLFGLPSLVGGVTSLFGEHRGKQEALSISISRYRDAATNI